MGFNTGFCQVFFSDLIRVLVGFPQLSSSVGVVFIVPKAPCTHIVFT